MLLRFTSSVLDVTENSSSKEHNAFAEDDEIIRNAYFSAWLCHSLLFCCVWEGEPIMRVWNRTPFALWGHQRRKLPSSRQLSDLGLFATFQHFTNWSKAKGGLQWKDMNSLPFFLSLTLHRYAQDSHCLLYCLWHMHVCTFGRWHRGRQFVAVSWFAVNLQNRYKMLIVNEKIDEKLIRYCIW